METKTSETTAVKKSFIESYLWKVYFDFQRRIAQETDLKKVKMMCYKEGQNQDYSKPLAQAGYLLHYGYAYMYEYKEMYKKFFAKVPSWDKLKITSIGCGNLLDGQGLVAALYETKLKIGAIEYEGVDKIDWSSTESGMNHKAVTKQKPKVMEAEEFFDRADTLSSDVYVFPKSISELGKKSIEEICRNFEEKKIEKDRIHFLIAFRRKKGKPPYSEDLEKCRKLKAAVEKNGFVTADSVEDYEVGKKNVRIDKLQADWVYPENLKEEWINLLGQKLEGENMVRYPIMTTNYMCYLIMSFERN